MPASTRRVNRGGGHSYVLDGEPVDSVTRVLREGVPARNLIGWAARTVAGYAVDHWDELGEQKTSERLRALEKAAWGERDAAAVRGTAVHALAEQLGRGLEVEVPEHLLGHVDAYLAFAADHEVVEVEVERTVVYRGATRATSYMGTLDLLATLDGEPDLWLLDWKTGASGIWPEVALQLAAYAHAQTLLDGEVERPMPHVDRAAAVWLRADGYDLIPVDISDATFRTFQYAQQLAAFTSAPREQYVGEAIQRAAVAS